MDCRTASLKAMSVLEACTLTKGWENVPLGLTRDRSLHDIVQCEMQMILLKGSAVSICWEMPSLPLDFVLLILPYTLCLSPKTVVPQDPEQVERRD